jgi:hypothetical protein
VPFLRVIRDKRGYETTYLMHWLRDGNRQRSRILYVFRTPGGVRVGREWLEPDVLREIETLHPGISFDWKTLFANQQLVESSADTRRPRKRTREEEPSGGSGSAASVHPREPPGRHTRRADRLFESLVSRRARAGSAAHVRPCAAGRIDGAR